eukprot:2731820-Rhodomonas_salina.3
MCLRVSSYEPSIGMSLSGYAGACAVYLRVSASLGAMCLRVSAYHMPTSGLPSPCHRSMPSASGAIASGTLLLCHAQYRLTHKAVRVLRQLLTYAVVLEGARSASRDQG